MEAQQVSLLFDQSLNRLFASFAYLESNLLVRSRANADLDNKVHIAIDVVRNTDWEGIYGRLTRNIKLDCMGCLEQSDQRDQRDTC